MQWRMVDYSKSVNILQEMSNSAVAAYLQIENIFRLQPLFGHFLSLFVWESEAVGERCVIEQESDAGGRKVCDSRFPVHLNVKKTGPYVWASTISTSSAAAECALRCLRNANCTHMWRNDDDRQCNGCRVPLNVDAGEDGYRSFRKVLVDHSKEASQTLYQLQALHQPFPNKLCTCCLNTVLSIYF